MGYLLNSPHLSGRPPHKLILKAAHCELYLTFVAMQRPLLVVVVITEANEEVR